MDSSAESETEQPNIVVILADDLGYADLTCFGGKSVQTPHIDSLASEGLKLTSFYGPTSVCSPNRASFLTGRLPQRHGMTWVLGKYDQKMGVGLRHTEILISEVLKERGYTTGMFGKWHLGYAKGSRPIDRGFDRSLCGPGSGIYMFNAEQEYPQASKLHRNGKAQAITGYSTDLFADAAIDMVRESAKRDKPFFIYLAFNAPHWAFEEGKPYAPAKYLERFADDPRRDYLASIAAMDDAVGSVLASIEQTGATNNTLVVFAADNGGDAGGHKWVDGKKWADNGAYSGGKFSLNEGGLRIAGVMRWPAQLPAGETRDQPLSLMDLFPMFADVAGSDLTRLKRKIDGRNPIEVLVKDAVSPHDSLYFFERGKIALRAGQYKWLDGKVYDLSKDPGETRDLAKRRPAVAKALEAEVDRWRQDLKKP